MRSFLCTNTIIFLAAVLAVVGPPVASADIVQQVGTIGNESAWTVSLDGITWYSPFQAVAPPGVSAIGIQQDLKGLDSNGDFEPAIGGADLTTWNGMWIARYRFFIPIWASDIHFHLNSASVDDKAAIFVNSFPVGFFALEDKTGPGNFEFADNPTNVVDVDYISSQSYPSWGFDKELHPGLNLIEVYVDNTDDAARDLFAPSITDIYGSKLYTYLSLDATVSYVPEPGTWVLLLTLGGFLFAHRIRRQG